MYDCSGKIFMGGIMPATSDERKGPHEATTIYHKGTALTNEQLQQFWKCAGRVKGYEYTAKDADGKVYPVTDAQGGCGNIQLSSNPGFGAWLQPSVGSRLTGTPCVASGRVRGPSPRAT